MKQIILVQICIFFISSCHMQDFSNDKFSKNKTYNLNLNPKPGSVYYYDIDNNSEIKLTLNDNEIHNINKSNTGISYIINKDNTGNYLLNISYERIHIYTKNGEQENDADSKNAKLSLNPTERMLGILKNASLTAVVTPKGEIKDISGYKELCSQLMANLDTNNVNVKQTAQSQLDKIVGSQLIQKNLNQLFKIFPDSAVHIGDKWKINTAQNGDFNLNVKSTFHLEDINKEIALVKSESEIEGDHTPLAMMGYSVIPNLKGTQKASYEVETSTGILLNSNIESEVKGNLEMMGREIPISIKVKVTMKGKKTK